MLGNVYSTGTFTGTAIFDSFTLDAGDTPDIFVIKQNPNGEVLWITQFDCPDFNLIRAESIVVDTQGNVYTAGYFYDSITIGDTILTSSEQETRSAFVTKQDTSGNVLWAKKLGKQIIFLSKNDDRYLR